MDLIEEIKAKLTIDDVYNILEFFGGEPIDSKKDEGILVSRTICHNPPFSGKYKLYYRHEQQTFTCFTDCGESFDILTLIVKIKSTNGEVKEDTSHGGKKTYRDWNIHDALMFIKEFLNIKTSFHYFDGAFESIPKEENDILKNYSEGKRTNLRHNEIISLQEVPNVIENYPVRKFKNWEDEGISLETLIRFGIKYDPVNCSILIPHYDIDNRLIGIRQRTLIKELEEKGKYMPFCLDKKTIFAHPLNFNLYGLSHTLEVIRRVKKVILFEGEKSVLMIDSLFGKENNFSNALCGSNLNLYRLFLLLLLGVEEIIIGFDRQYHIPDYSNYSSWIKTADGKEYIKWMKKLIKIKKMCSPYVRVTFLIDKRGDILDYKDSPIDKGKEKFAKLFERRQEHLWNGK